MISREQILSYWIEPSHLTESSLTTYRSRFLNDPFRLVLIRNFLTEERAQQLLHFLAEEASYEKVHTLKKEHNTDGIPTKGIHVTKDEWEAAASEKCLFRLEIVTQVSSSITTAAGAFMDFIEVVQKGTFNSFFTRITDEPIGLIGLEAHRMQAGDFVGLHSDDRASRRLGFVVYLSPSWSDADGGELVFETKSGGRQSIRPEFNCLLLFDVACHTGHRVEPVVGNQPRLSLQGWCLKP